MGQEVKDRGVDIVVVLSELGALAEFDLVVQDAGRLCYGFELDLGDMGHWIALGQQNDELNTDCRQ